MDLLKLPEFIEQYPAWFKIYALSAWAIATVLLAFGFLFLRTPTAATERNPAFPAKTDDGGNTALVSAQPVPNVDIQLASSPEEYMERLAGLSDRFYERSQFIHRHHGAEIEWQAFLDDVSLPLGKQYVFVALRAQNRSSVIVASLPSSLETKAFALQKGDIVKVKGKLNCDTTNMPTIDAVDIQLLMKALRI